VEGRFLVGGGGIVSVPIRVPFVRPPAPDLDRVTEILRGSWDSGALTNGPLVAELERRTAELVQVPHVVAVSSCTTGLMLAVRALAIRGEVLMPSFTFSASAHAVAWNGATPRFAECDPTSFQLDLDDASRRIEGTSAILATHVFGAPSSPKEVEDLARRHGVPVIFDAAHAFGALHAGVPVGGFGDVEVFSLTPTKPLVAGEGGLVATKRDDVADAIRIGRDYANPGDYNTRFVGLNGRMSEMHAAVALASLEQFASHQARRLEIVERYCKQLAEIPGIRVQSVPASDRSSWKDFTIAVDEAQFGADREGVRGALRQQGIDTRCYFDPPVHEQDAYREAHTPLPTTERVARQVLSLPVYPSLSDGDVDLIAGTLKAVHRSVLAHGTRDLPESANSTIGGGTSA
jgi:dTDP-4-amino-4,6-dideoxygalactose transaminase